MKRILQLASRSLLLLALLLGMILAILQVGLMNGLGKFGSLYLPTESSLQAHADKLATHMIRRLGDPPMPLQIEQFDSTLNWNSSGGGIYPPWLASRDLPERIPLRWSSVHGWLSDTPPEIRDRYQRFFDNMAHHAANDEDWESVSLFSIFGTAPSLEDSVVMAGQWTFTDEGTSFRGALTPGFYQHYARRWFSEYTLFSVNNILDNWMWNPAEFQLVFEDSSYAPLVLRKGQPVDLGARFSESDSSRYAEQRMSVYDMLNGYFAPEPNWRDHTRWFKAAIHPGDVSVRVASPFLIDGILRDRARQFSWAILVVLVLALVVTVAGWVGPKHA